MARSENKNVWGLATWNGIGLYIASVLLQLQDGVLAGSLALEEKKVDLACGIRFVFLSQEKKGQNVHSFFLTIFILKFTLTQLLLDTSVMVQQYTLFCISHNNSLDVFNMLTCISSIHIHE
ncbi:hypothetical protein ACJX0J_017150, partial [Zea mays]